MFDPIKNILNETDFLLAKVFRRSNQPVRKEPEAEHRLNALIRVPEVRLVGDNLEDLSALLEEKIEVGVYKIAQVLAWAEKAELDLVEITPNAVPPVCRITDYQKFLYQKKKREKEIKANTTKTVIKEIRFTTETGEHDIEFKVRHAIEFLKEHNNISNTDYQNLTGVSKRTATRELNDLRKKNILTTEGITGKGMTYQLKKI